MSIKSLPALLVSVSLLALPLAQPVYAADNDHTVTCKDGTTSKGGKGACSHHGGVEKGGASASAHDQQNTTTSGKTPTAKCKDGTMSYGKEHNDACGQHGGVAEWLDKDKSK